jgi:hypothetical protein
MPTQASPLPAAPSVPQAPRPIAKLAAFLAAIAPRRKRSPRRRVRLG